MLAWIVVTVHVIACLILIVIVLLQQGKGAEIGAVFGGSSQTVFGSSGAGNFLTRLTTATAILFMATSLILTYGTLRGPGSASVVENIPLPPQAEAPAEQPAAEASAPEAAGGEEAGPTSTEAGTEGEEATAAAPAEVAPASGSKAARAAGGGSEATASPGAKPQPAP